MSAAPRFSSVEPLQCAAHSGLEERLASIHEQQHEISKQMRSLQSDVHKLGARLTLIAALALPVWTSIVGLAVLALGKKIAIVSILGGM